MQHSFYHSLLRVSSLSIAFVLLFESGLINPLTRELSENTHEYLASAIGVNATVSPNELNQLTAELTAQKQRLNEQEAALARQIDVNLNRGSESSNDTTVYILSAILFVLLVLIVLNYTLDYVRYMEAKKKPLTS